MLEVVDSRGEKIGIKIARADMGSLKKGEFVQAVHIWIRDKNGKFLIQKTSPEKGSIFAVTGGMIECGQSHIETAVREIKEELGITVQEDDMTYLGNVTHGDYILLHVYLVNNIFDKKFVLQESEVESLHWMSIEELEERNVTGSLRASTYTSLNVVGESLS